MSNFFSALLTSLRDFLNGITNTTWGLIIIFWSMHIMVMGNHDPVGYYFAGIGSTLLGISHNGQTSTITNSTVTTPAAVNEKTGE